MRVLLDTSVLVAAMVEGHPSHARAFPWLERGRRGAVEYCVAAHSLAETFAVLSSYPVRPRISPSLAARLVRENVAQAAEVIALGRSDYESAISRIAELALSGGAIYDALIAQAARKAAVDRLLTLDLRDFLRVWPDGERIVSLP